jgi:hypothetical protein
MWIRYYEGFESIEDLLKGYDIEELLNYLIPDEEGGDWQGTIKITAEYFPSKDDEE